MTQAAPDRLRATAGVFPGMAAMLGAGLLVGLAPASAAAGRWLIAGIVLAFLAALCGALSTSDQSRRFAGVGGGYLYTRHQLGVLPGRMAGSVALVGRICAGAAVAGTFGVYVVPHHPVIAAIVMVAAGTVLDASGFRPSRMLVMSVVIFVVAVFAIVVVACFAIAPPPALPLPADVPGADDASGLLTAAGAMFFAFLGFEHVTSTNERVYTIHQSRVAIPVILTVTLGAGVALGVAALRQLGGGRLALSPRPLYDALIAADAASLTPLITAAAAVATSFGVLTAIGSIRRTLSAMAEFSDVPPSLANVGPRGVSVPAAVLSGIAIAGAAGLLNPPQAIEVAACLLLFYYAFTNASARLLMSGQRVWPRRSACFGLGLSVLIGMNMSVKYLVVVVMVMAVGCVSGAVSSRYARR
ncbi:APC family permease [Actinocrispum wychmicini]|uniref:APA family basic amino acid/polyamine antiporter n=1 Tax=Actinocrispum wychmicini TaxID=1213861 RepID=A0A4R2IUP8_9PSEU|nr:APC family permease [Actinocrispum wychmicini]TCO48039.1 APA family basic amino acid/polyamine antiporter [Actinocrispum wychmicini]